MSPRPRASIAVQRAGSDGSGSRIGYVVLEGGDVEALVVRCATGAEYDELRDYFRAVVPTLAPPRTLTRRKQLVDVAIQAARRIDVKLSETEVARLHGWARATIGRTP